MGIHPIRTVRVVLRTRTRKIIAGASVLAALGGAGTAFAYIVGAGQGSANGTTAPIAAPASVALTVTTNPVAAPVYGGSVNIPFMIKDNSTSPALVSNVAVTVTGTSSPSCLASWFTVTPGSLEVGNQVTLTLPAVLPSGTTWDDNTTPWTLNMPQNDSVDQSSCIGATVSYSVTVS